MDPTLEPVPCRPPGGAGAQQRLREARALVAIIQASLSSDDRDAMRRHLGTMHDADGLPS